MPNKTYTFFGRGVSTHLFTVKNAVEVINKNKPGTPGLLNREIRLQNSLFVLVGYHWLSPSIQLPNPPNTLPSSLLLTVA